VSDPAPDPAAAVFPSPQSGNVAGADDRAPDPPEVAPAWNTDQGGGEELLANDQGGAELLAGELAAAPAWNTDQGAGEGLEAIP
jgi:hypothetical protein